MPIDDRSHRWLLYGSNGYTGRLIAREARARGMQPILAGRDRGAVQALAGDLACAWRAFPLTDVEAVAGQLADVSVVLNCAGPFGRTAQPMIEACLAAGASYLDLTGEIDVIQWAAQQHGRADLEGITIMPAVGFDVVPSDCLAAVLAEALPTATHLRLAFTGDWSLSPGTAKTMLQRAGDGGRVRVDGRIVRVPTAWKLAEVPFPGGQRWATTFPWGDVAAAYHTTGIPNIEVYIGLPRRQLQLMRGWRWLEPLAKTSAVQRAGHWLIDRYVKGPSAEQRSASHSEFWGRVTDAEGRTAEATLVTPDGYSLTVQAALEILRRVLDQEVSSGFWTPGKAFGGELIEHLPGVRFQWQRRPAGDP